MISVLGSKTKTMIVFAIGLILIIALVIFFFSNKSKQTGDTREGHMR
jgi:nitrogen fixation-related uncharacterized protein